MAASSTHADDRIPSPRTPVADDMMVEVEVADQAPDEQWYYINGVWYSDGGQVATERYVYATKKKAFAGKPEDIQRKRMKSDAKK